MTRQKRELSARRYFCRQKPACRQRVDMIQHGGLSQESGKSWPRRGERTGGTSMSFFCKMRGCGGSAPSCPRPARLVLVLPWEPSSALPPWRGSIKPTPRSGSALDDRLFRSLGHPGLRHAGRSLRPAAQLIGGHVLSALVGVAAVKACRTGLAGRSAGRGPGRGSSCACRAFHPPGGATA